MKLFQAMGACLLLTSTIEARKGISAVPDTLLDQLQDFTQIPCGTITSQSNCEDIDYACKWNNSKEKCRNMSVLELMRYQLAKLGRGTK